MSWTESVYLDCVAPDGTTGFVARLARHVDEGVAWLWVHAFRAGEILAFHDQTLPCTGGPTAVDEPDVAYELSGRASASFRRHGRRDAMEGASLEAEVSAHGGGFGPAGAGEVPLRVIARFTPERAAGGTLPGRTEVLGRVTGEIVIAGQVQPVSGWAQWHEQHQTEPRFTVPFTYATIRGDDAGAVLLCGPRRSGGLLWRDRTPELVTAVELDPPGEIRAVTLHLATGGTVASKLTTAHRYAVAIDGRPRPGTFVRGELEGAAVAGCVNDWDPTVEREASWT